MNSKTEQDKICCPPFQPELWDDKLFEWENKRFIKGKVSTILYVPLNFGQLMRKLDSIVRENEAIIPDYLCLSYHISKWKMDLYLAVDKEIPGIENILLSGKFYSKVYEGSFKNTGKWSQDFKKMAEGKNMKPEKMYMWYTTCPKCSKKHGKNYVVIVGKMV